MVSLTLKKWKKKFVAVLCCRFWCEKPNLNVKNDCMYAQMQRGKVKPKIIILAETYVFCKIYANHTLIIRKSYATHSGADGTQVLVKIHNLLPNVVLN